MDVHFYIIREGMIREDIELLFEGDPILKMDGEADIMCGFQGDFYPNSEADLLHDRIVCQIDGEACGEFVVSSCKSFYDGDCALWRLEAKDQGLLLCRHRQEGRFSALAGESYLELIHSLLNAAGISRILSDDCTATLLSDRQWELGARSLDMVNELLQEIGFCRLYFDREGYARLKAYTSPQQGAVSHVYGEDGDLLEPDCVSSLDVFSAKNVFAAVADSPERNESWTATAANDDPNSPISTVQLGRIMAKPVVFENVASRAVLQSLAEQLRDESMLSLEEVGFSTAPSIHGKLFEPGETVALEHPQLRGIFQEKGWQLHLGEGRMEHQARRLFYL